MVVGRRDSEQKPLEPALRVGRPVVPRRKAAPGPVCQDPIEGCGFKPGKVRPPARYVRLHRYLRTLRRLLCELEPVSLGCAGRGWYASQMRSRSFATVNLERARAVMLRVSMIIKQRCDVPELHVRAD